MTLTWLNGAKIISSDHGHLWLKFIPLGVIVLVIVNHFQNFKNVEPSCDFIYWCCLRPPFSDNLNSQQQISEQWSYGQVSRNWSKLTLLEDKPFDNTKAQCRYLWNMDLTRGINPLALWIKSWNVWGLWEQDNLLLASGFFFMDWGGWFSLHLLDHHETLEKHFFHFFLF